MACGCSKRRSTITRTPSTTDTTRAVTAASSPMYEVWRNGAPTGRRFTSLISAQATADRMGGEVRTV